MLEYLQCGQHGPILNGSTKEVRRLFNVTGFQSRYWVPWSLSVNSFDNTRHEHHQYHGQYQWTPMSKHPRNPGILFTSFNCHLIVLELRTKLAKNSTFLSILVVAPHYIRWREILSLDDSLVWSLLHFSFRNIMMIRSSSVDQDQWLRIRTFYYFIVNLNEVLNVYQPISPWL